MKKIITVVLLGATLGACATAVDVDAKIKDVQGYTKTACSFVPSVATVAKILAVGLGGSSVVNTAADIADAVCTAVTTAPLADGPGDRIPRVNGVEIKGYRVK
jgi:hypothetical protein